MGAVAVSKEAERQIQQLCKQLGIPTKAGLIRIALMALEAKTEEERLRHEIQESARRCGAADREENRLISAAAVARRRVGG